MSNVHVKLKEARKRLRATSIKKSGFNSYSKYYYFELADFINPTLDIFDELELFGFITYTPDIATLKIICLEDESSIEITSPMSTAKLTACHEVQNLGAVETYIRRYLWITAMEILEHDALDSTTGKDKQSEVKTITADQATLLNDLCKETKSNISAFCAVAGVSKIEEIPADQYQSALNALKKKKANSENKQEADVPQ